MDFKLTREQEMLRDMVRQFAETELAPLVPEFDANKQLSKEIIKRMGELGLFGILAPREYGGTDMGHLAKTIMLEEISKVYASAGFFFEGVSGGIGALVNSGTKEQKDKYLAAFCKGEKLSCFALTEPSGGSDLGGMQMTAELVGDEYVVNGRKVFITLGGIADIAFFIAKTTEGFSTFMVENGTPGYSIGRRESIQGLQAIPVNELIFSDCHLPKENLIGKPGRGLAESVAMFAVVARPSMAAVALGISRAAMEIAQKFAKERKLQGKPIGDLQAIQFMLADMDIDVEASKWLCYHLAWLLDQGKGGKEIARDSARAKLFCTEAAVRVCLKAIQILGGYGTTHETQLVRRLQDAIALLPATGTNEIMRVTIGRDLAK
jgi:alkylation response protein AidB-like acyl-CoA dehydrogenase